MSVLVPVFWIFVCVSPGSNRSCGCIVLFRPSLSLVTSWSDSEGRLLQCEFLLRGVRFRVISLYAPNRNPHRNDFLDSIHTYVDPSVPTILARDFNSVFDRAVDRRGSCADNDSRESSVALTRLFTNCCCVDVWRHLFPSRPGFTWTRSNGVRSSRIDLIGCPTIWAPFISCLVIPCRAPFLIIAVCVFLYLCPTLSLLVVACGNLISLFCKKMLIAS